MEAYMYMYIHVLQEKWFMYELLSQLVALNDKS